MIRTLNDAVNEVLKHAPAFKEIRIIPSSLKANPHTVIADGRLVQGEFYFEEDGVEVKVKPGMRVRL